MHYIKLNVVVPSVKNKDPKIAEPFIMPKLFIIWIFAFLSSAQLSLANDDIVYQYPATPADIPKLIEVSSLMGFVQSTYAAGVHEKGLRFRWNFDWNQSYMGAGSSLYQGEFSVLYLGGFSRVPESNFGVVALILCHEFGHLLGGEPRQRLEDKVNGDWSSAEGQSDWFAATDCLPKVYEFFKKQIETSKVKNEDAKKFCSKSHNQDQCEFVVTAGLDFSKIGFKYFNTDPVSKEKIAPSVKASATEKPEATLHSNYPSMQCRLDTYKQGALCSADQNECLRPRCWFNPE